MPVATCMCRDGKQQADWLAPGLLTGVAAATRRGVVRLW